MNGSPILNLRNKFTQILSIYFILIEQNFLRISSKKCPKYSASLTLLNA